MEWINENLELILIIVIYSIAQIISIARGQKKTAEDIEKAKKKSIESLRNKNTKYVEKITNNNEKINQINKEINKE